MATKKRIVSEGIVCPLCGDSNSTTWLINRPDYEYGVGNTLRYAKCKNQECGFVFAVDAPPIKVVKTFYTRYSTHSLYRPSKIALVITYCSALLRRKHLKSIFFGRDVSGLKVLDYGCGAGDFMRQLTGLGVGGVFGYDFDPEACRCARNLGLKVYSDEGNFQANGPYDFIFLNHVIEHLVDPEATMGTLLGSLKYGGHLVLRTPNASSFLAKLFGDNWRGWETPRHLHIFNTRTVSGLVGKIDNKQLLIVSLSTSNAMFIGMFHGSFHTVFWKSSILGKLLRHLACFLILPLSLTANVFRHDLGEEVVLVLKRTETN